MPILSINWNTIKSKLDGQTQLFALTDRQASMLFALSEQFTWEKTWRTPDYDFADYDELQAEVADLQANLTMPVALVDIIQYIDEIEDLLRALQNAGSCCVTEDWTEGEQYVEPITEGETNGVPEHLVDSGWADDTDDWDGFYEFQCHVANALVNDLKAKVIKLEDVFDAAGAIIVGAAVIAGLIGLVFASATSVLVAGLLASVGASSKLWTALQEGTVDAVPSPEEIEQSRDALVCAWIHPTNDGVDDRIAAWRAAIDDEFNLAEAAILKLIHDSSILRAMYTGKWSDGVTTKDISQAMVDAGITPGTYECDCEFYGGDYYYQENWTSAPTSQGHFGAGGNSSWCDLTVNPCRWALITATSGDGYLTKAYDNKRADHSITDGDPVCFTRAKVDITLFFQINGNLKVEFQNYSGGWNTISSATTGTVTGWNVPLTVDLLIPFADQVVETDGNSRIKITVHKVSGSGANWVRLDNCEIWAHSEKLDVGG